MENIEIDTRGADRHPERYSYTRSLQANVRSIMYLDAGAHVCAGLASVLPRLRSLRLRLGGLCPALSLPKDYSFTKDDDWDEVHHPYLPASPMQKWAWEQRQGLDIDDQRSWECLDALHLVPNSEEHTLHRAWLDMPDEDKQVLSPSLFAWPETEG